MTALDQARALRQRGLSVFRIPLGTKVPDTPWKQFQDRVATDDELVAWFPPDTPMNVAVVTGAISAVVVVDVDDGDALAWARPQIPATPWMTETPRGLHFWFQHPGGPVPNRTHVATDTGRLALDIRGDGGYVIAPGSIHATGVRYREAGRWEISKAHLPIFRLDWFRRSATPERVANHEGRTHITDTLRRARAYLAAIPRPDIGCGSDAATFSAACRLVRGFALSADEAEDLLWTWAGGRPGWTRAWIAVKVASAQKSGTEQIGGLLS